MLTFCMIVQLDVSKYHQGTVPGSHIGCWQQWRKKGFSGRDRDCHTLGHICGQEGNNGGRRLLGVIVLEFLC